MNDENYSCIVKDGAIIDLENGNGWICPRCGNSVSPKAMICPYCNAKRTDEGISENEQMIFG